MNPRDRWERPAAGRPAGEWDAAPGQEPADGRRDAGRWWPAWSVTAACAVAVGGVLFAVLVWTGPAGLDPGPPAGAPDTPTPTAAAGGEDADQRSAVPAAGEPDPVGRVAGTLVRVAVGAAAAAAVAGVAAAAPGRAGTGAGREWGWWRAGLVAVVCVAVVVLVLAGTGQAAGVAPPPAPPPPAPAPAVTDLDAVLDNVRNWLVGILATVATLFFTVGGVRYSAANGDPGEVDAAKRCFRAAAVGYALAVLAPLFLSAVRSVVGA